MNLTGSARNGANATSSFKRRRRPQRHQRCNWTFGGKRKNDRLLSRCSRSVVSSGRLQRRGGAVWAMCETPQADPRQEAPETVAERKRMTPLEMITQIQQQEAEIKGLGLRSECVAPQSFEHRELGFAIGTVLFAKPSSRCSKDCGATHSDRSPRPLISASCCWICVIISSGVILFLSATVSGASCLGSA